VTSCKRGSRARTDASISARELGLAIGLHALEVMKVRSGLRSALVGSARRESSLRGLLDHVPLASAIESNWLDPVHQNTQAWREHRDINEVMLATSLVPEGCLVIAEAA
jgi:hypothetical protein